MVRDPYFARSVMLDMNKKIRTRQYDIDRNKRHILEMQKDHQVMRDYVRELEARNTDLKNNYIRGASTLKTAYIHFALLKFRDTFALIAYTQNNKYGAKCVMSYTQKTKIVINVGRNVALNLRRAKCFRGESCHNFFKTKTSHLFTCDKELQTFRIVMDFI